MTDTLTLRRPEAIERELWQLERDVLDAGDAVDALRVDIEERDVYDGGRSDLTRAQMERDADHGRLSNTYRKGHAYMRLSAQQREQSCRRDAIRGLRRELRFWSARVPVGMVEIAALLGYSAEAPRQWKHRNVLPAPAGSISGTPYWWRPAILLWAIERGRTRAILPDDEATDYAEDVA